MYLWTGVALHVLLWGWPQPQMPQEKNLLARRATATEIECYYIVIAWIDFGGAPRRGYGDIIVFFFAALRAAAPEVV